VAKSKPKPEAKPTVDPKPIAAYLRVSTSDQKTDSQRAEITAWLQRNGYDLGQVGWYVDVESGRKMSRPDFDRLKADIFQGHVKQVIVYKLDRVARRLREGLDLICDWCDRGIRLVSITQAVDVSGSVGRLVASLLLGLAEIEWEYRRDRQKAGIRLAKTKGVYQGRKAGAAKGSPERARELIAKGLSVPEVATTMGVSVRTVFRYLRPKARPRPKAKG
jgi:DNA invertase Pin-like site-specific DNA recombinase